MYPELPRLPDPERADAIAILQFVIVHDFVPAALSEVQLLQALNCARVAIRRQPDELPAVVQSINGAIDLLAQGLRFRAQLAAERTQPQPAAATPDPSGGHRSRLQAPQPTQPPAGSYAQPDPTGSRPIGHLQF